MTPTEQDNELRWKIARQMSAHRYPWGHTTKGEKNEAARDAMESPYFENIMQLITDDRKRVALEARIDELMRERKNDYWPYYSDKADSYNTERIAELKAQQEEV